MRLVTTDQVHDEVQRNKELEVARAIKEFEKSAEPAKIPRWAAELPAVRTLTSLQKSYLAAKASALNQMRQSVTTGGGVKADLLVLGMFQISQMLEADEAAIRRADLRRLRGSAPGKGDSIGDQLHWELLLEHVPDGDKLCIVSSDPDFASTLFPGQLKFALSEEWRRKKGSEVSFFSSLGDFTKAFFPEIEILDPVTTSEAITQLVGSETYADAHLATSHLIRLADQLTHEEAGSILAAVLGNQAVAGTAHNADVQEFYLHLYEEHFAWLPGDLLSGLSLRSDEFSRIFQKQLADMGFVDANDTRS